MCPKTILAFFSDGVVKDIVFNDAGGHNDGRMNMFIFNNQLVCLGGFTELFQYTKRRHAPMIL